MEVLPTQQLAVLVAYVLIMIVPALALLVVRRAAGPRGVLIALDAVRTWSASRRRPRG